MTHRSTFRAALGLALLMIAGRAVADEPGIGKAPVPVTGKQVYETVCQACHMADGKGAVGAGAFPALASNPRLGTAAYPIMMVTRGRGGMPWFTDILTPAQLAAVITYVRTNFGNHYAQPVTEADVARMIPPPGG